MIDLRIEDENCNIFDFVFVDLKSCTDFMEHWLDASNVKCKFVITKSEIGGKYDTRRN